LRRSNEIDWPTLLRVMNRAADEERSPFDAARELTARLFSEQRIVLGFRGESGGDPGEIMSGARREGEGLFGLKPTRREILNLAGDWEPEPAPGGASAEAPLAGAWLHRGGRWVSALSDAAFVSGLLPPHCRLCRLDRHEGNGGGKRFGGELALATRTRDGAWLPTRPARAIARLPRDLSTLSREEVETLLPEMLAEGLGGGAGAGFVERGNALSMLLSFAEKTMAVLRDRAGHALIDPPRREVAVEAETHYKDRDTGETRGSAAGSAARAWRKLGLTDEHGKPTERGTLFSFFQRGEGLAVAAGIEDESYPIDELLWHLVNLRAGYRFSMADVAGEGHGSERLAAACRRAYGPVDYEGYLQLGVPPGYGEGAAEAVEAWLSGDLARKRDRSRLGDDDEAGPGDIERAYIEWLSLLRHLRAAPTHPNPRWRALKDAAAAELKQRGATASPGAHWPTLPASILQRHPQHRLSFRRLGPAR
ncbi:MAG: hypothetical protein KDM91_10765, partial [Verrucomicrobiae bacterium]|nr:hypothetical protein [Verrucomicrobiae bacterium]